MSVRLVKLILCSLLALPGFLLAEEQSTVDQARQALAQQEGDDHRSH